MGLSDDDVLATAVELTAASVALAIERFLTPRGGVGAVYASGGGVRNADAHARARPALGPGPRPRRSTDLGVTPEAKEALAFAFLAHQTLCGLPGNVPERDRRLAPGGARPDHAGDLSVNLEARRVPASGDSGRCWP